MPRITAARFEALVADHEDPLHGTNSGYSYGCRCDRCRSAHTATARSFRARRANGYRA